MNEAQQLALLFCQHWPGPLLPPRTVPRLSPALSSKEDSERGTARIGIAQTVKERYIFVLRYASPVFSKTDRGRKSLPRRQRNSAVIFWLDPGHAVARDLCFITFSRRKPVSTSLDSNRTRGGIRRHPRCRPPRRQRLAPPKRTKADRHRVCPRKSPGRCCARD